MISTLIDKQDNFEIVRDQIAGILALEVANQIVLATNALKDPELWRLRVYAERSNPWEQYLNAPVDKSPIVNVWYEGSTFDPSASDKISRQKTNGIFNIDCFGYAVAADDPLGGYVPGDKEAALEVHRALRLVRNILMSSEYTYLGLRGLVWGRWIDKVTVFQPSKNGEPLQQVVGARIILNVAFNELSPQTPPETLEYISIDIERAEDGQVIAEMDFDFTT